MSYFPSLDETPDLILTGNKSLKTVSSSVFLGDIVSLEDNAGFASYVSLLTLGVFNLVNFRSYTQADGTDDFIQTVRLGAEEFGTFQPGFDETQTISGDETIEAVFTQLQDAFNYKHIFRGTQGKLTFDLFVDKFRRDLPPDNFTDAQLLALPDDELLRLVNSRSDILKPSDFDNPDDPPNDADTLVYKNARNFEVGRKLIIKWRSDDGNPTTVKGDTIGGNFIPFFQTFFADRFIDREYPDRHSTIDETEEIDAPFANIIADPTVAAFDITLVDSTEVIGAPIAIKKLIGTTNDVTLKPQVGQTIEGLSEYVLSGELGPAVTIFSDGTSDWKISSIFGNTIGSLGFKESATLTTIGAINTYVDISGTMLDVKLLGFTRSGGELTYVGSRDVEAIAEVSITTERDIPASSARTIRAAVFLDTGSGFVEQNDSFSMTMVGSPRNMCFQVPLSLQKDDIIKVQIKNEDTTDDIVVVDYNLTVSAA